MNKKDWIKILINLKGEKKCQNDKKTKLKVFELMGGGKERNSKAKFN